MAQQIKLDSKAARLKLPVRRKPYTNRIAPGVRLCYRRNEGPFGSWSVLGGGGVWLKKIGIADDVDPADGVLVHLPKTLLSKTVMALNARELRRWRDGLLAKGLAPSTVGRTCKMAKAAL